MREVCYPRLLKKRRSQYVIESAGEFTEYAIELHTETPQWSTHWKPALGHDIAHSGAVHWQLHLEPRTETLHWSQAWEQIHPG